MASLPRAPNVTANGTSSASSRIVAPAPSPKQYAGCAVGRVHHAGQRFAADDQRIASAQGVQQPVGRSNSINKTGTSRIYIKSGPVLRQPQGRLHTAGNTGGSRWSRKRCRNAAGNLACCQPATRQGLAGGGNGQRGGILTFGAVIPLADAGAGRDPFIAGVHLSAQILIRHYTAGQCPPVASSCKPFMLPSFLRYGGIFCISGRPMPFRSSCTRRQGARQWRYPTG